MLRLLIDENLDHRILRGLKYRLPEIDSVVVQQIGLAGFKDPALLKWAAENDRILLTHDNKTMIPDAEHLLMRGEPMAGVIFISQKMAIGRAIEELEILIACSSQEEFRDQIKRLPL